MNKFCIDTVNKSDFTASSKAREDATKILNSLGFKNLNLPFASSSGFLSLLNSIKPLYNEFVSALDNLPNDSAVLIQYPWEAFTYKFAKKIKQTRKEKDIKFIVLIHDLVSIRSAKFFGRFYYKYVVKEIKYINSFDKIISHNASMSKYLISQGIKPEKLISLNLFDYLCKPDKKNIDAFNVINIAGNLDTEKAKYLKDLENLKPSNYKINLYGVNFSKNLSAGHIDYKGSFPPEVIINKINKGFGLVWDGDSINTCNGPFGDYLRYNNPHKCSMYLAAGLPVIIWSKSAMANFVEENNVGILVDSLFEIDKIISELDVNKYNKLIQNVASIKKNITTGKYLLNAIDKISINKN